MFIGYYRFNYNQRHIMATPKTVRILSIDGGGCRGYMSLCFMERFLAQWGVDPTKLYQYFDVMAGASAGGILIGGAAKGISPTEAKTFFTEKAPWIFTIRTAADVLAGSINASTPSNRPDTLQKVVMLGLADPFYKAVDPASNYGDVRLQAEVANLCGTAKLSDLPTNVVFPSFEMQTYTPILFSNANLPDYTGADYLLKDVICSTAAAPIYFPPIFIQNGQYMDGGLWANNPVLWGYELAKLLYPDAKRFCILSVGSGLGDVGFHVPEGQPAPSGGIPLLFALLGYSMCSAQEGNARVIEEEATLEDNHLFYYRFQTVLDRVAYDTRIDNSDPEFFAYLETAMNAQYNTDAFEIAQFISRLNDE